MMPCGPIRHTITARQVETTAALALDLIVRETPFTFAGPDDVSIQGVFRALVSDENRTAFIADDVLQALRAGRRCLVLSEWKEQCRALATQLINRGKAPVVLDGSVKKKAQRAILSAIHEAPASADLLIVATGQYLGEGFDCPQIDTLFLAFPVSFRGKLVQYVGRAMRASAEKSRVLVYDYDDIHVPILKRMHQRRIKTYQALGFGRADRAGTPELPMSMNSIMIRPRSANS